MALQLIIAGFSMNLCSKATAISQLARHQTCKAREQLAHRRRILLKCGYVPQLLNKTTQLRPDFALSKLSSWSKNYPKCAFSAFGTYDIGPVRLFIASKSQFLDSKFNAKGGTLSLGRLQRKYGNTSFKIVDVANTDAKRAYFDAQISLSYPGLAYSTL